MISTFRIGFLYLRLHSRLLWILAGRRRKRRNLVRILLCRINCVWLRCWMWNVCFRGLCLRGICLMCVFFSISLLLSDLYLIFQSTYVASIIRQGSSRPEIAGSRVRCPRQHNPEGWRRLIDWVENSSDIDKCSNLTSSKRTPTIRHNPLTQKFRLFFLPILPVVCASSVH